MLLIYVRYIRLLTGYLIIYVGSIDSISLVILIKRYYRKCIITSVFKEIFLFEATEIFSRFIGLKK